MICYASRTGTSRNLDALRDADWGLLVSRAGRWRTEGFGEWCGDNGAWSDYQNGRGFDDDAFERFLEWAATQTPPRFIVLPDIVAGGLRSLELSMRWSNRCRSVAPMVLLAVQDGMTEADVAPLVSPTVGVFLGGSTPWKISTMAQWGAFCRRHHIWYHVARVNTAKRMAMAIAAFAKSVDGTSATRYAKTLPLLDRASRQADIFAGVGT